LNPSAAGSYSGMVSNIATLKASHSGSISFKYSQALFYTSAQEEVVCAVINSTILDYYYGNLVYNFIRQVSPYSFIVSSILTLSNTFDINSTISLSVTSTGSSSSAKTSSPDVNF